MSAVGSEGRSHLAIGLGDLKRLAEIALKDRKQFFHQHPKWAQAFQRRVLCTALCQGAAKHYVDGVTGINDFDVYTFYRRCEGIRWYAKRIKSYDFGDPKFGQSVDRPDFIGRRVDCMGREIEVPDGQHTVEILRRYLGQGRTKTAKLLAAKAVVLLEPLCGTVVWPITLDWKV